MTPCELSMLVLAIIGAIASCQAWRYAKRAADAAEGALFSAQQARKEIHILSERTAMATPVYFGDRSPSQAQRDLKTVRAVTKGFGASVKGGKIYHDQRQGIDEA